MKTKTSLQQSDYNGDHGFENVAQPSSQVDFTHTIQSLQQETARLNQDVNRLHRRSTGLIGILVGIVLLFGGTLGWSILRMQTIERTTTSIVSERIEQIEKQIIDLNRQVSDTVTEVREKGQAMVTKLENQLEQLKAQLQSIGISVPFPSQMDTESPAQTSSPGLSSVTSQTKSP